jgi:hypothetical protein
MFSGNPPNSLNSFIFIAEQTLLKKKVFMPSLGIFSNPFTAGVSG